MNLIGHDTPGPELCCCCLRPAIAVCVHDGDRRWFHCTYCNYILVNKIMSLKNTELHALEKKALADALAKSKSDLCGAVLRALVDHGVNDLGSLHGGNYPAARSAVYGSAAFEAAMQDVLVTYTLELRGALRVMKGGA